MNPIEARMKAVQKQLMTLQKFASTPSGIFETIDQMVKNFRMANRGMLMSLGMKTGPAKVQGQLLKTFIERRPKILKR